MKTALWADATKAPMRRFGLLDAVVLMAALGVGFWLARVGYHESLLLRSHPRNFRASLVFRLAHDLSFPCIGALSAAMIVLRLRRPRPPFADILRQPGFVGCAATTLVFAACLVSKAPDCSVTGIVFVASFANAYLIIAAWFAVLFGGCLSPEPGWLDRMARVLCISGLFSPFLLCLGLAV